MATLKHKHSYEVCRRSFEDCETVSKYNKRLVLNFIDRKIARTGKDAHSYNQMRINSLKWLAEYFGGDKELDKLTHNELSMCAEDLKRSKLSKTYLKKRVEIIVSFYSFLCGRDRDRFAKLIYYEDDMEHPIFHIGKITKLEKKEKPVLSIKEVEQLITKATLPHYAYYFAVMFDGGLRSEEFLALRFKDFKEKYHEGQLYYELYVWYGTHNGNDRTIALTMFPNVIKEQLDARKKELGKNYCDEEKVFHHQTKTACEICNKFVKKEIAKILEKPNAKKFHNHSLRHSSCSYYYCNLEFSEADLEARFGWEPTSRQKREYIILRKNVSKKSIEHMRKKHSAINNEEITNELKKYTCLFWKLDNEEGEINMEELKNDSINF